MSGSVEDLSPDATRALELLDEGGVVSITELRAAGVLQPAQSVYELELRGWPVRRTSGGWRLAGADERRTTPKPPVPRVRRLGPQN